MTAGTGERERGHWGCWEAQMSWRGGRLQAVRESRSGQRLGGRLCYQLRWVFRGHRHPVWGRKDSRSSRHGEEANTPKHTGPHTPWQVLREKHTQKFPDLWIFHHFHSNMSCLVISMDNWTAWPAGISGIPVLANHTNLYSSVFFIICSHLSIYCLALQNAFSLSM